jgi:hypothetical protein
MVNVIPPIKPDLGECCCREFLERMGDARSHNEVVGLLALKYSPHRLYVVGSPTPIAADREVVESKPLSAAGAFAACVPVSPKHSEEPAL